MSVRRLWGTKGRSTIRVIAGLPLPVHSHTKYLGKAPNLSNLGGGLNRSTQHFILERKDGVW